MITRGVLTAALLASVVTGGDASAVSVTASDDAEALVGLLLGPGITVVDGTQTFSGASGQAGAFTDGLGSIGLPTGLILSTGLVEDAVGPNIADGTGSTLGGPGSTALSELIGGTATNDAAILTFEFVADAGELFFNFVFASDEYNEFANSSFNDVFGFFLNDENIALVPGTDTPVSIDSVNGGNPLGDDASNEEFFNNNDLDDGGPFFDVEYDGFTDVFTATGTLVDGVNTISLAIADGGDSAVDSAVFIQGGTFSTDEPPPINEVPEPTSLALLGVGVMTGAFVRRRRA